MSIFGKRAAQPQPQPVPAYELDDYDNQLTLDTVREQMKNTSIEYIVSLSKAEKDKFFEGAELIWQGYQKVENIKTKDQRALQRAEGAIDPDAELDNLIDGVNNTGPANGQG